MQLRACLAVTCALVLFPLAVSADPDVWERAKHPRLVRDIAALREAQNLSLRAHDKNTLERDRATLIEAAVRALERDKAYDSPDVRVPVLYGRLLQELSTAGDRTLTAARLAKSISILEASIARAPDDPNIINGYYALAIAYAKTGQPSKEVATDEQLLAREADPDGRAMALGNQAEAYMVMGDIDRSVATFRSALAVSYDHTLARWGLAVALDRSGDHEAAIAEATMALRYDPNAALITNDRQVFFVPDYDRFWYQAIGAMARARQEARADLGQLWWGRAAVMWTVYIDSASTSDRWLSLAQSRRTLCEKKERALKSAPKPVPASAPKAPTKPPLAAKPAASKK